MHGKSFKRRKQHHYNQLTRRKRSLRSRRVIEAVKKMMKRNLQRRIWEMAKEQNIADRSLKRIVKEGLCKIQQRYLSSGASKTKQLSIGKTILEEIQYSAMS